MNKQCGNLIHAMEYHSALRMGGILSPATPWIQDIC